LKGSRRTTQPLLPAERDGLLELARTVEGRFFKMSRETFWRRMKAYGAEAGLPSHRLFPHALKHSAGRLGYLAGMGIPELVAYLGHKNPSNSLIYAQAGEQEAASAFAAAFAGVGA
ncbi:MAG: tyrosine-type recombinase/integrase, partial [Terriglobales bacterium]